MKRLLAITDRKQRKSAIEHRLRRAWAFCIDHRSGPTGKDDAFRIEAVECLFRSIERSDFGINAGFANAARDQLRDLAAEVDDENGFGGLDRHGWRIAISLRV